MNRDELFQKFHSGLTENRIEGFKKDGRLFDLVISQQLDNDILSDLFTLTNKLRAISKSRSGTRFLQQLLDDKKALIYFEQPSSRTFLSFKVACQILGMRTVDIRDSSLSSEVKGESFDDTLQTFSSYVDLIIMRSARVNAAERASWLLKNYANRRIPIINGGSGYDQHPTQALLDIYTLMRSFEYQGGIDGKRILFCGDLKRGRTVRSLSYLMKNFRDVFLIFVAPPHFQMEDDILTSLDHYQVKYQQVTDNWKELLPTVDIIYMTRVQDEYDRYQGETDQSSFNQFKLTYNDLALLKPNAAILHPFPRRDEIDVAIDVDPRAKYWRQERNGMWIRSALIAYIFQVDKQILAY